MTRVTSGSSDYIEISSDEDSCDVYADSDGVESAEASKDSFEKFLKLCASCGVSQDSIDYVSHRLRNASRSLLAKQSFSSLLQKLSREMHKNNAENLLGQVRQNVCVDHAPILKNLGQRTDSSNFSGDKADDESLDIKLEQAKGKILQLLINSRKAKRGSPPDGIPTSYMSTTRPGILDVSPCIDSSNAARSENGNYTNLPQETSIDKNASGSIKVSHDVLKEKEMEAMNAKITKSIKDVSDENPEDAITDTVNCEPVDANDDDVVIISVTQHEDHAIKSSKTVPNAESNAKLSHEKKQEKVRSLIKSIKRRLKFYDKEIKRLMEAELTLDEMDNADSSYIKECKLKSKYSELYKKLCQLQGQRDSYRNNQFSKVIIEGCPYPEINREAESFVKSKNRFPDFFEIKNVVEKTNKKYKIGLKVNDEINVAKEVFTEIGNKLQKKRKREFSKLSGNFLTDKMKQEDDPALNDASLKQKLKQNKRISKSRTEEVFRHFSRMEYQSFDSDDEEIEKTVIETQKKVASVSPKPEPKSHHRKVRKRSKSHTEHKKVPVVSSNVDTEKDWGGNSCLPKDSSCLKREGEAYDENHHEGCKSVFLEVRNEGSSRGMLNHLRQAEKSTEPSRTELNESQQYDGNYTQKSEKFGLTEMEPNIMPTVTEENNRRVKPTLISTQIGSTVVSQNAKRRVLSTHSAKVVTEKKDFFSVIVIDSDED